MLGKATHLMRFFAGTKLMLRNLPWTATKDEIINSVKSIVQILKKQQISGAVSQGELISKLRQAVSADRVPGELLKQQAKPLDSTEDFFARARKYDSVNEKRPE